MLTSTYRTFEEDLVEAMDYQQEHMNDCPEFMATNDDVYEIKADLIEELTSRLTGSVRAAEDIIATPWDDVNDLYVLDGLISRNKLNLDQLIHRYGITSPITMSVADQLSKWVAKKMVIETEHVMTYPEYEEE